MFILVLRVGSKFQNIDGITAGLICACCQFVCVELYCATLWTTSTSWLLPHRYGWPRNTADCQTIQIEGISQSLKKVFGLGTPPSCSNLHPADLGWSSLTHLCINRHVRSCKNPSQVHPLPYPHYQEGKTTLLKQVCNTKEDPVGMGWGALSWSLAQGSRWKCWCCSNDVQDVSMMGHMVVGQVTLSHHLQQSKIYALCFIAHSHQSPLTD